MELLARPGPAPAAAFRMAARTAAWLQASGNMVEIGLTRVIPFCVMLKFISR